jgi:hypothetical protein
MLGAFLRRIGLSANPARIITEALIGAHVKYDRLSLKRPLVPKQHARIGSIVDIQSPCLRKPLGSCAPDVRCLNKDFVSHILSEILGYCEATEACAAG